MIKTLYFAGGCFWGPQAAFDLIRGVKKTTVGYAQSVVENPSYEMVCTGHTDSAETVKVEFDEKELSFKEILDDFFKMIDPTLLNRQGPDTGRQYRSGIYSTDSEDLKYIKEYIKKVQQPRYNEPIVVEVKKLENFYPAEMYHQEFLKKNPGRYCHIDLDQFRNK